MSAPEMLPKADVMEASKAMLQKQLYIVFTTPTNGLGPVLENLGEHLEFQMGLEKRGIMFAAGPLWTDDEAGWKGEGMVVIRAGSRDEATAIAESDPMHQRGARSFRIRPWMINEGGITLKIGFSGQTVEVA